MNPAIFHFNATSPYYNGCYYPGYGFINPYAGYQQCLLTPPPSPQMHFNAMGMCTSIGKNQLSPAATHNHQHNGINLANEPEAVNLTLAPPPKRRRLSSQSSVSSVSSQNTLPDVAKMPTPTKTTTTKPTAMSDASFIQKAFAPLAAEIEKIGAETLTRIMPYNPKMVRKFPKKERSAKEQERRDKNTLACRISRCKEKIKLAAMEQQYNFCKQRTDKINRELLPMAAYLNELIRYGVAFKPDARNDLAKQLGQNLSYEFLAKMPIKQQAKRDFSIAFLLGLQ